MKILILFKDFFDMGVVNAIFIHVRNIVYCALILAAGSYVHSHPADWFIGTTIVEFLGYPIIGIGILLMLLNLADGIYRISKLKHHIVLEILLVLVYITLSLRLMVIMWEFRMQ